MAPGLQDSARGMRKDSASPELDIIPQSEGLLDLSETRLEQLQQVVVADVAGSDDKQPGRRAEQQMAVAEVRVLGDHNPTVPVGHAAIC